MRAKVHDRQIVVRLRKQGKSYREIMQVVPVSKGTISKWCGNVPLTKKEAKFLQERSAILQDNGRLKTALKNKARNDQRRERMRIKAKIDFERFRDDPYFILGLTLYWADGAKKNNYFSFLSSDQAMIKIMMTWCNRYLATEPADYKFRLYIQESYKHENYERFWSRACAIPRSQFQATSYTANARQAKKNPDYAGCLRMVINGVTPLIIVKTWQNELSKYYVDAYT